MSPLCFSLRNVRFLFPFLRDPRILAAGLVLGTFCLDVDAAHAQEAPSSPDAPPATQQQAAPVERATPVPAGAAEQQSGGTEPAASFDPAIFLSAIPPDQLASLRQFDGAPSRDLWHDKQFRKLLKAIVPNCTFHYGRDMSLDDALDMVISGSRQPVVLRDGRYLLMGGTGGPYLAGRGFVWVDLQRGFGLGGFFFTPTNGEPTPTLAVFSRQIKEDAISLGQLPPEFAVDMARWAGTSRVPTVETLYFLNGSNHRVLLEHDIDYCSPSNGTPGFGPGECDSMDADAADLDEVAAYYLEQVHHATNATAWMIGPDQTAFLQVRERTCGGVADPLGCRIRVTRAHTRVILHQPPRRR